MTWIYAVEPGWLKHVKDDGTLDYIAKCYSGLGDAKNDPEFTKIPSKGPIPLGGYTIGAPFDSPSTGHYVMRLTPDAGTKTFGRSDFEIHGESKINPGRASHGCIVTLYGGPPDNPRRDQGARVREVVHESNDADLMVVAR